MPRKPRTERERTRSLRELTDEAAEAERERRRQNHAAAGRELHYSANRPITLPCAGWMAAADKLLKPEVKKR